MVMKALGFARGLSPRAEARPSSKPVGVVLTFALCLVACPPAYAWGPAAHRIINTWAVETLPPEVRGFFEANRQFLVDHSNDPDAWIQKDRYERKRHFIYLDKYGLFPYLNLPHSFQRAVTQHGSGRINRDGLLPWHIGEYSLRLTNALKAHNLEEAKLAATALGHYVADAHNPLHTTQNFDGHLSGQTGLASRFGVRLVDRYTNFLIFHSDEAAKIDDPTEYAFEIVLEAHTWVNHIILADRRSLEGLVDFNDDYLDRFYTQVGSIAMRGMNAAARDTGSYWYTAWLNAGRPAVPGR